MNTIKELRQAANMSQSEFANRLNVTQGAVSQWENGVASPTIGKLMEIAKVLGCTVADLLADPATK